MLLAFLYFSKLYCTAINMIGIFVVLCFLHFSQYIGIFEREKSWKLLPCIWQDLYLTAFQGRRRWRMEEIWIARCTNCKRQKWNLAMQKSLAEICTNPCENLKNTCPRFKWWCCSIYYAHYHLIIINIIAINKINIIIITIIITIVITFLPGKWECRGRTDEGTIMGNLYCHLDCFQNLYFSNAQLPTFPPPHHHHHDQVFIKSLSSSVLCPAHLGQ